MIEGVRFALTLQDQMSAGLLGIGNAGRKAFDQIDDEVEDLNRSLRKTKKESKGLSSSFGGLGGMAMKAGGLLAGVFAIGQVVDFGRGVIETTAKFEKFEAVLTNTFGSAEEARGSMKMLQDFAAKTPFSLDQLTGGYVKLVNQGFKPTEEEMRKLGDLAASTGKDFDQLSEAILDASTGEMERLKEFGVKGSQNRDGTVSFRFKGETTTIQNTEKAIRDYILSLGDAQGVAGSMEAISKTLGGQLSNLGDNFMNLQKVIGEGSGGVFSWAIEGLNKLIDGATFFASWAGENKDSLGRMFDPLKRAFKPVIDAFDSIIDRMNITSDAGTILENIFNGVATVIQWVSPFVGALASLMGTVYTKIYDVAEAMSDWYKETEWVQTGVKVLYVVFKNAFIDIAEMAADIFGGIADIIAGIFNRDLDQIEKGLGGVADGLTTSEAEYIAKQARFKKDMEDPMGMVDLFGDKKKTLEESLREIGGTDNKDPFGLDPTKPSNTSKTDAALSGSVSGSGSKNLSVKIENMIAGGLTINVASAKEGVEQLKQMINEALTDSIRDFELSYE